MPTPTNAATAPLPEAIDGLTWKIEESAAPHVNFASPHMAVPLSDTDRAQFLRLHEMGHVKWTPRNKDPNKEAEKIGARWSDIQTCEDMRIHGRLTNTSRDFHGILKVGGMTDSTANFFVRQIAAEKRNQLEAYAQTLVATYGTGDYDRIINTTANLIENAGSLGIDPATKADLKFLLDKGPYIADQVAGVMGWNSCVRSFSDTLRAAKFLRSLLDAEDMSETERKARLEEEAKVSDSEDGKYKGKITDQALAEHCKNLTQYGNADREGKWGTMNIKTLPMTESLKKANVSRRPRAYEHGCNPRFIHRLPIDGNVFAMKRKAEGGTVLIDTSGSMSLSDTQVNAIIEAAPCSTIAIYSGTGREGALHIVAIKGQRASNPAIKRAIGATGSGNIVDGPALLWLSRQSTPRIWVCDGRVTGVQDVEYANLTAEARAITAKAFIRRVPNMEAAVNFFQKLKAGDPSARRLPTGATGY